MTELTDLSDTDALNTAVTGQSTEGNVANMGNMDSLQQAILGMLSRFRNANIFRLRDNSDNTKLLAFDLSGLTTATTRTITMGDANVTLRPQTWEHIETKALSGETTGTFTGLSAYRFLRASFYLTLSTDNESLYIQTSVAGTFATSGADYNNQFSTQTGTATDTANASTFGLRASAGGVGNASPESISGTVSIFELNKAVQATHIATAFGLNSSTIPVIHTAAGRRLDSTARDGIRFLPGAGTITGTIVLEGIRG